MYFTGSDCKLELCMAFMHQFMTLYDLWAFKVELSTYCHGQGLSTKLKTEMIKRYG